MSMNEVGTEAENGLDLIELYSKLDRIVREIKELKEKKKDSNAAFNDSIKDLEAERDDILALIDKAKNEAHE